MGKLSFFTRGQSTIKNKPKVYLAYQKNDYHLIESIANELLSYFDCAIFYVENYDEIENYNEHLNQLDEMNLFVMIITNNYLSIDNFSLNTEFLHAKNIHLPILPLMQQDGLTTLFNQKCGDIQYLDKNDLSDGAISYEEKLKNFLDATLYKDTLVNDIKNEFDGYIFLSYRKKDRIYAQQLMKIIHELDFCRDIAIWYDEFLIPGENFNELIAEVLNKCDLVALTVTPNLVNEPNYIMSVEYPLAKKVGKVIIPAELVKTDVNLLNQSYNEMPNVINVDDINAINSSFLNALSHLNLRKNDNPKHNYYIGLAYLYGIDVEKNNKKGLLLILSAADNNCIEAMKKLSLMYLNGDGVDKDYLQAIVWQEKIVSLLKNKYIELSNEENSYNYLYELGVLISYYDDVNEYNKAINICNEKLQEINKLLSLTNYKWLEEQLVYTYSSFGNIYKDLGNKELAKSYYEKSVDILNRLIQQNNDLNLKKKLSQIYNFLAGIYQDMGDLEKAYQLYLNNVDINEKIYKDDDDSNNNKYNLCLSYGSLGDFLYNISEYEKADLFFDKALNLSIKINEQFRTNLSKRILSLCYLRKGNSLKSNSNYNDALNYYLKANKIDKELLDDVNTILAKETFSLSCNCIADLLTILNQHKNSIEYLDKSHYILTELTNNYPTEVFKLNLGIVYYNYGLNYMGLNDKANATIYFNKSKDILEKLINNTEANEYLAKVLNKLADFAYQKNNLSECIDYYEKACFLLEQVFQKSQTFSSIYNLAESFTSLGTVYLNVKNYNYAFNYVNKTYTIYKTLIDQTNDAIYYEKYAWASYLLAQILHNMNLDSEVNQLLSDAYRIYDILYSKYPDRTYLNENKQKVMDYKNKLYT